MLISWNRFTCSVALVEASTGAFIIRTPKVVIHDQKEVIKVERVKGEVIATDHHWFTLSFTDVNGEIKTKTTHTGLCQFVNEGDVVIIQVNKHLEVAVPKSQFVW